MSLVALQDYKDALKIVNTSEDDKITQYSFEIEDRVKAYLGYDVEETTYTDEIYDGSGNEYLFPRHVPVTSITSLYIYEGLDSNGNEDWEEWTQNDEYSRLLIETGGYQIFMDGAYFPKGRNNVKITYVAGYTANTLPQDIASVCKRLMRLLYLGVDKGHEGLTSVSSSSGFTSTTTLDSEAAMKILKEIEHYKLMRV